MNAATDGDAAAEPKRRRKEAIESVIAALDAGRDPKVAQNKQEFTLNRAEQTTLEGCAVRVVLSQRRAAARVPQPGHAWGAHAALQ